MKYISTRGRAKPVSSASAIKNGIAPDSGLYMPEYLPALSENELRMLGKMNYIERAAYIMSLYLDDFTLEELTECCRGAYSDGFDPEPARVVTLKNGVNILELFNGPTCAFKDMALQVMPRLFVQSMRKTGETRKALILTATSGDTGKAALEGYRDIPGVYISVYYPTDGVSEMQKMQMATQEGGNLNVSAIYGNFDDAQTGVKEIFADESFSSLLDSEGWMLSSANSINWGRLLPQIVYYVSAFCDLAEAGALRRGDTLDVAVPTGNFGNILAAFMAKRMGVPIGRLICASNENNVLTDFFNTGVYDRNRALLKTSSPSMDILVSSNLERLIYMAAGSEFCRECMESLAKGGSYSIGDSLLSSLGEDFAGYFCNESECRRKIAQTFEKYGYLADPHTAVALFCAEKYACENPVGKMLVVSTASAYKFPEAVCYALSIDCGSASAAEKVKRLSEATGVRIPGALSGLFERRVRFSNIIDPGALREDIIGFIKSID